MFHVKNMVAADLAFAVRITDTMGWELAKEDFKFMMKLEPQGCFVLFDGSKRIGVVTTISFDKVGWLGNLIVIESHRKRGAGSILAKHSLKYLTNRNVETIGLYAYIDKVPFYSRLGFEYDSEFTVLHGIGFSSPTKTTLREARKEDIQPILDFDRFCFGASRRKLLQFILADPNNLCYLYREDDRLLGYVTTKVYEKTAELGPLVCRRGRSDIAIELVQAALNRLGNFEVSVCIPKKESAILNTLMGWGFSESFPVARMFFGPSPVKDCISVAESLERG